MRTGPRFVESKHPARDKIWKRLEDSQSANTWTNFGPVAAAAETFIRNEFESPQRSIVTTSSGTSALHALVATYSFLAGKALRWVVSAFTFACQRQGILADALVVDVDQQGSFTTQTLVELGPDEFDGIIHTPLFGMPRNLEVLQDFAKCHDKLLLLDAATCVACQYRGRPVSEYSDGAAFSFHHTKPLGFGEGGYVALPAELEDTFRSIINFGRYKGIATGSWSMNAKLSDVSAAFILDRLESWRAIREQHRDAYQQLISALDSELAKPLLPTLEAGDFPSLAALQSAWSPTEAQLRDQSTVLMKYYRPLSEQLPDANQLFNRTLCAPLHKDISTAEVLMELRRVRSLQAKA